MKSDSDIIKELLALLNEIKLTQDVTDALASFVCSIYCPRGICIPGVSDTRWHLFCKRLPESNAFPPTVGALEEHLKRVRIQSRVWHQTGYM